MHPLIDKENITYRDLDTDYLNLDMLSDAAYENHEKTFNQYNIKPKPFNLRYYDGKFLKRYAIYNDISRINHCIEYDMQPIHDDSKMNQILTYKYVRYNNYTSYNVGSSDIIIDNLKNLDRSKTIKDIPNLLCDLYNFIAYSYVYTDTKSPITKTNAQIDKLIAEIVEVPLEQNITNMDNDIPIHNIITKFLLTCEVINKIYIITSSVVNSNLFFYNYYIMNIFKNIFKMLVQCSNNGIRNTRNLWSWFIPQFNSRVPNYIDIKLVKLQLYESKVNSDMYNNALECEFNINGETDTETDIPFLIVFINELEVNKMYGGNNYKYFYKYMKYKTKCFNLDNERNKSYY